MVFCQAGGDRAEVGLLPFARVALEVATAVLPRYRTPFSKHPFTQPQLLAVLCLMRYEDWTFRETEVRLREHGELRRVLRLHRVPDYTTLYRFLKRLDEKTIDQALGAISTFFVRRMYHHTNRPMPWRHWLQWLLVADLDQQIILAQTAHRGPTNDCASLRPLVGAASRQRRIGLVLADAEFDRERNHTCIRQQLRAQSILPAQRGNKTWRIQGIRAEMRRAFPGRKYARCALIETLFSVVKRKLSARAPGRTLRTQQSQALLLGLAFNLYRWRHLSGTYPGCQQSQITSRERGVSIET